MNDDMIQAAIEAGMSEEEAERAVEDYNYNLEHQYDGIQYTNQEESQADDWSGVLAKTH